MTRLRKIIGAMLAASLLGLGFVLGQGGVFPLTAPVGTEQFTVQGFQPNGQPSPVLNTVTMNQVRNTTGYQLSSLTSGALTLPTATNRLIFTAVVSGALAVTTPPAPFDGEMFEIVNGSSGAFTGTVTLTANAGQTVQAGAVATLAQNGSAEWQYSASTTTWYRMR